MRTTFDLPDDLLKRAKIAAVERGATLRELMTSALQHELEGLSRLPARKRLIKPPIHLAADSPLRALSVEELKRIEAEEEAEALRAVYR